MKLPKHMPALDGLRGVAILMVLMTHAAQGWQGALAIYPGLHGLATTLALPLFLKMITEDSGQGVTLFFVVSAFTLTIRAAHDGGDFRNYALRRVARIGPAYWIAGLAYTLAGGLAPRLWAPNGIALKDLIIAAIFGSAWSGGASMAVVPGGWSVSCEAAFYVSLPVLVRLIDGRIWRSVALTVIALVIAQARAPHALDAGAFMNPIEQAPAFLCGVTAALVTMRRQLPSMPVFTVLLVVYAVAILPLIHAPLPHLMPNLSFAPVAAVAVALAASHPPAVLANRIMRRIGEVSYSMYLVHFALLATSLRMAEWLFPGLDVRTLLLHFTFTVAGTFALASVTYRFIEKPAIRWAARISRRRADKAITSAHAG